MTAKPVRVLIGDDNPVFRHGLRALLDPVADIHVVGETGNSTETIAAATRLAPHVVVMDLHTPPGSGITATTEIRRTQPHVAVLMVTMNHDDDRLFAALRAGARGYLLKQSTGTDIISAVRAVARGEAVFGHRIADRVIDFFATTRFAAAAPFPQLTNREREVLDLLARGLTNHAIAARLTLSTKTIGNRVSDIFTKLRVTGRAQAVAAARDAGLGTAP
jgi:DNA-binding NarL/FixJ family response regulator